MGETSRTFFVLFVQTRSMITQNTWILVVFFVLFVGSVIFIQQKFQNEQVVLVQPDQTTPFDTTLKGLPAIGQTFIPDYGGLQAVYLPIQIEEIAGFIRPETAANEATLTLHLREAPEANKDIRTATIPVSQLIGQNLARFTFPPLPDSFDNRYYFFLESQVSEPDFTIRLYYGSPTSYINGAGYLNGSPQDWQASFYLAYDRPLLLQDWAKWLLIRIPYGLAMAVMVLLPGGALLVWFYTQNNGQRVPLNHIEWLGIASGLSVAIYALLMLTTKIIGGWFNSVSLIILLILSGIVIIGGIISLNENNWIRIPTIATLKNQLKFPLPILLFWFIFILSVGVRVFIVRGQDFPLWGDSYHHTVISQLIVDHGGLFNSWEPYAPQIQTLTYHFGFHTLVAMFHWLTGVDVPQAVLAVGQLLNVLTVPLAFLLGRRFGGSDWAGTFAALISGLISEYPIYYVNWGRYTQLAGQTILPVVMVLSWLSFCKRELKSQIGLLILTTISLAGLMITHYRVTFFYLVFIIPVLGFRWGQRNWSFAYLKYQAGYLGVVGIGAILLLSPWVYHLISSRLSQIAYAKVQSDSSNSNLVRTLTENLPSIFEFVVPLVVILGISGILWGCWQRREEIVIIAIWGILLIIIANPQFVYLPGTEVVTYFAVLIAAYLPFSILAGFVLGEISQRVIIFHRWSQYGITLLIIVISMAATYQQANVLDAKHHSLVTQPDLVAMEWIQKETSDKTKFWVNSFLAYDGWVLAGTDAGWWLPFLTRREGIALPMIYGLEMTRPVDYPMQIIDMITEVQSNAHNPTLLWQTLRQYGITHIYIGQQRGSVWGGRVEADISFLKNNPHFRQIYRFEQVLVFELDE